MKKKICSLIFGLTLVCSSFVGCGNNDKNDPTVEYYGDTTIEELETFTSLTGIELNISQSNSTGMSYNYIMDYNAESVGAMVKYEDYIRNFGFERNEELEKLMGDYNSKIYVKDGYLITLTEITTDNIIQYVITIPQKSLLEDDSENDNNEDNDESNETDNDELYKQLVDFSSQGKYQEAYDLYKNSSLSEDFEGYSDSKKYMFYAQAMIGYENGALGYTYSILKEHCGDILDAPQIIKELDETIGQFNGIYKATSGSVNYYIYIKDGEVATDLKGDYESEQLQEQRYIYNLIEVTYDTGEKTLGIGSCLLGEVDIDYVFIDGYTSNDFTLVAWWEGNSKTFNGVYTKISDSTEY